MPNLIIALSFLAAAGAAAADPFNGRFLAEEGGEPLTLQIAADRGGAYRGSVTGGGERVALFARRQGESLVGEFDEYGERWGFVAQALADGSIRIRDEDGEVMIFRPARGGMAGAVPARAPVVAQLTPSPGGRYGNPSMVQGTSGVTVNRQPLDPQRRAALGQAYQMHIADGAYWYDARSGAWGVDGGPTAGFIAAGLDLPGPMPADASGGGTGIYINGREIHPMDRQGLQQLFGITYRGNFWLDSSGNLGPVGGQAIANIVTAVRANQQRQAGGAVTHGYGKAHGSRGTLSGGMYSGRTASGKSVFYYPGM